MKERIIKIDATISEAPCPCGKGKVYNYDALIDHNEICSTICTCDSCKEKYTVRYNPCNKKMYFINNDDVVYTYVNYVRLGKITKAHYENEYTFSLKELDELDLIARRA